MQYFIGSVFPR